MNEMAAAKPTHEKNPRKKSTKKICDAEMW